MTGSEQSADINEGLGSALDDNTVSKFTHAHLALLGAARDTLTLAQEMNTNMLMSQITGAEVRRNPSLPIRVLFLVHHIEAIDGILPVYDSMLKDSRFEPVLASCNRRFPPNRELLGEADIYKQLSLLGYDAIRFADTDPIRMHMSLRRVRPHVIVRQSQWDNDIDSALSFFWLRNYRTMLIPYEMIPLIEASTHDSGLGDSAFDSDFHRTLWLHVLGSESMVEAAESNDPTQISKMCNAPSRVGFGHPKAHRLAQCGQRTADDHFTILWAPHHSIGNNWHNFGLFRQTWRTMVKIARENVSWRFVFRPHPALHEALRLSSPPLSSSEVRSFLQQWTSLPNTSTSLHDSVADVFSGSDVLVSDGISWLAEYQVTGRPVIFLERKDHVPFAPWARHYLDNVIRITEVDALSSHLIEASLKKGGGEGVPEIIKELVRQDCVPRLLNHIEGRLFAEI